MRRAVATWTRLGIGSAILLAIACGGGGGGGAPDVSGLWYVGIGQDPKFTMTVFQSGDALTFEIQGADVPISGTGAVGGATMTLDADLTGLGHFHADLQLEGAPPATFLGTWTIPEGPMDGTMTGTRQPWATWDFSMDPMPAFAEVDCVDLSLIGRVSRFRSGAGHDYSDDFETCRSMKHYFEPKSGVDFSTIRVYAPFAGVVVGTQDEYDGALWKGTAIGIRPDGYDAFHMVLFHVDLHLPLAVGDHVAQGQELGTSEKQTGTALDIAFGVHTSGGYRLVSYFEVMTNTLFQDYVLRGMTDPSEAIITAAQRDADPLTCDGQEFQDGGSIPNWVTLN